LLQSECDKTGKSCRNISYAADEIVLSPTDDAFRALRLPSVPIYGFALCMLMCKLLCGALPSPRSRMNLLACACVRDARAATYA
jgi:hypothetical protein